MKAPKLCLLSLNFTSSSICPLQHAPLVLPNLNSSTGERLLRAIDNMSLFGAAQQPQQQTSAFGSPFNKPLFGASTQQTSQPQQNSSLFGGLGLGQNQQQQQPQQTGTSSLFGGANKPTTSLFGQSNAQQNQAQAPSGGLFGGGNSTQQQSQLGSSFANNNVQLTQLMQQSQISARLEETLKPRTSDSRYHG